MQYSKPNIYLFSCNSNFCSYTKQYSFQTSGTSVSCAVDSGLINYKNQWRAIEFLQYIFPPQFCRICNTYGVYNVVFLVNVHLSNASSTKIQVTTTTDSNALKMKNNPGYFLIKLQLLFNLILILALKSNFYIRLELSFLKIQTFSRF